VIEKRMKSPVQKSPPRPLWLRWSGILLGVGFFIWLPFEDQTTQVVTFLAIAISIWSAIAFFYFPYLRSWPRIRRYVATGLLAGIAVTPITLLLIIVKTGLHAHPTPDFTNQQILLSLQRMPIWIISGILTGFGIGLISSAIPEYTPRTPHPPGDHNADP
jgi:hypothetical protein